MPSLLLQTQFRFAAALPRLIDHARDELGLDVTVGEVSRSDEQAEINALGFDGRNALAALIRPAFPRLAEKILNNGKANGIRNSLHQLRLAVDLQLYDRATGDWIKTVGPYAKLGEFWKSLAPDHRWGGDFGDTPHYSIEFGGVK